MSVIDTVLQGHAATAAPELTLREAAVTVLVGAVAADGTLAPAETARVNMLLPSMRLYRQMEPEHLQHLLAAATQRIGGAGQSAGPLLAACAAVIPDELRAPLFALAVDLVFADDRIAEREKQYIDALQAALEIEDQTAIKIVEVLLMKNRV
jgi:uncharacterized tellurite resistance protein B-like protein